MVEVGYFQYQPYPLYEVSDFVVLCFIGSLTQIPQYGLQTHFNIALRSRRLRRADRFLIFLGEYHKVNPLSADEIRFMREAYRFFILNYVIKDGSYFFSEQYAKKLRAEAFDSYLPSVDRDFDPEKIIAYLKIVEK